MRYRRFRQLSTGQLLQALMSTDDPRGFSVAARVHADQVAAGWKIPTSDVEAEDVDVAPDLTGAIAPPPPTAAEIAARDAEETAQRQVEFDQAKLIKAVAIWVAQREAIPLAQARAEIVAIYKAL